MEITLKKHYVKEWRKFRGLSATALASRAGCTQGLISQLEAGRTGLSGRQLVMLASVFECEPYEILARDPTSASAKWRIFDLLGTKSELELEQIERIIRVLPCVS